MSQINEIAEIVCKSFDVPVEAFTLHKRTITYVKARHASWFVIHTSLRLPVCEMVLALNRPWETIQYGIDCVKERCSVDRKFAAQIAELLRKVHEAKIYD